VLSRPPLERQDAERAARYPTIEKPMQKKSETKITVENPFGIAYVYLMVLDHNHLDSKGYNVIYA
jgi:hypothetical protein